MRKRRIFWQFFPSCLSIALLVFMLTAWLSLRAVKRHNVEETTTGHSTITLPLDLKGTTFNRVYYEIFFAGLGIVFVAALISLFISHRIARPLEALRRGATRFASGDLNTKLDPRGSEEVASLAKAMNQMARELNERLSTIENQRNELEAVLESMTEGVIAFDRDGGIININRAAQELLAINVEPEKGCHIQEVIRSAKLQQFINTVISSGSSMKQDLVLNSINREKILTVYGRALTGGEKEVMGALIVLNDVTHLRRLETMRQDFVANVSHELRTPITSIKGFVETLLDGAAENEEDLKKFLGIVAKHADRLNSIIEDLLSLSRIEEDAGSQSIEMERARLVDIVNSAIQLCEVKAKAKSIKVNVIYEEDLKAEVNPPLLEEAIWNLLDNAIKYSENNQSVDISIRRSGVNEVAVSVQDYGCGIEAKHLSRLFERFYRVDKARSRQLGGTGLGLALVKHIVRAHDGRVEVESIVGKGSTFSILL